MTLISLINREDNTLGSDPPSPSSLCWTQLDFSSVNRSRVVFLARTNVRLCRRCFLSGFAALFPTLRSRIVLKRTGPLQSRQPGYKALGNNYVCFLLYCGTLLAVGSQRVGWLRGSELAFLCVHEVAIAEEGGKPPLLSHEVAFSFST